LLGIDLHGLKAINRRRPVVGRASSPSAHTKRWKLSPLDYSKEPLVTKDKERSLKRRKGIDSPQRRFGFIAIETGFIKADHLYEALIRQKAQETGGAERRPLGMILKDLGYLTVSQIETFA